MLEIATRLVERGYRVDLLLVKAEGEYTDQVSDQIRLIDLRSNRAIVCIPKLVRYLFTEKPSVFFPSLPHISLISLAARLLALSRSQIVVVEHNTLSQTVRYATTLKERLLPVLMRLLYPLADGIIAVSNGVAEDLATVLQLPRETIQVIHNPVVTPELLDLSSASSDHPWFKAGSPPVILGVGRLTQAKGFPKLIRAFAAVLRTTPARLIILGDGPNRDSLENLVQDLALTDYVSLPGFVRNPYPYFRKSAVFVLSSLWEGLPTVLIEALACGTPVVSTDCPNGPREILEDGRWGILVPVDDEKSLAGAITDSLHHPKYVISDACWERFTLERSVSQYLALIKNLVD